MVHILFWNPDISSMTRERMTDEMTSIVRFGGYFDWSFWEHENVRPGDTCYLVRCNDHTGPHGVVLRGRIISRAYRDRDWSGTGRKVFYADWHPMEFIDSESGAPLSPDALEKLIPDFNWRGGHSGRELPPEFEPILEEAWLTHLHGLISANDSALRLNPRAGELLDSTLDLWKAVNRLRETD